MRAGVEEFSEVFVFKHYFLFVIPEVLSRESNIVSMFWIPGSRPKTTNLNLYADSI